MTVPSFSMGSITSLLSTLFYVFIGILGIGFLIGFHELGHFVFAKLFRVDTPSFSLGFGPPLFQRKIGNTLFRIAAIPLGGYVEMAGAAEVAQGEQKEASRRDQYSFAVKPYYQKMFILFGGILFNLLFAYCALILLFASGLPKSPLMLLLNPTTSIETVEKNSAAQAAGLQQGDVITSIDSQKVSNNIPLLLEKLQASAGKQISVGIVRNKVPQTLSVQLASPSTGQGAKGLLGVQFVLQEIPAQNLKQAIRSGIKATNTLIKYTFTALVSIFKQRTAAAVGGPLSIISHITKGAQEGIKIWILLLVLISINLAILNLVPLPILDGGQILFYSIEALAGRPLPEQVRMGIHYVSWALILLLTLYLTFKDAKMLLGNILPK